MTRLSRTADRLSTGSRLYARRLGTRAAAWCARGRRDDLTGWRAALGIIVRLALLALGAYLLARLVRALPSLMWLLTGWWTVAAWRAGRAPAQSDVKAVRAAAPEAARDIDREAVRTFLLEVMGDASAVHLRTVLAHLQQHPPTAARTAGWTVADLRARVEALGIPVPKVKAPGSKSPTRGVRRADLAPSPEAAEEMSTEPSTAA
ncbi:MULTISPECIES: hypothetical protein [Streptomyces]|uniref:hypothetical protein n=1 Tax=Streptomyces TaxID=1883 RepID=UPI0029AE92DD|nr:hypothetical protein [Streptomyces stelliscabiei]MDX2520573.1 hypothetical protein [Streptomyces stelliscabiei]MDX2552670.1 hypothetical protein [Streptomyces stelliscabiei]MDX2661354.1 hypothetical protein [Streptomyces stelliscabiei]MDX2788835.1 hypothetical protein [Streptomyces stelliscabiei]